MSNIINLGSQKSTYNWSDRVSSYSYVEDKQQFILEQFDAIEGLKVEDSVFQIQLDLNRFIQNVLTRTVGKQVTSQDINLEDHYQYLYGKNIYETEVHNSTYGKEHYETLQVFAYELTPVIRILKVKEIFYNFKPRKLIVSNEFQSLDDLNLDFELEKQILKALEEKQNLLFNHDITPLQ